VQADLLLRSQLALTADLVWFLPKVDLLEYRALALGLRDLVEIPEVGIPFTILVDTACSSSAWYVTRVRSRHRLYLLQRRQLLFIRIPLLPLVPLQGL